MNSASELADISARRGVPHSGSLAHSGILDAQGSFGAANSTLAILPLKAKHAPNIVEWLRARQRLGQLAGLGPGWNGDNALPPDAHTISFAATELARLERLGVPAPALNPSSDGALYAEWHMRGLDIEVIFEAPYRIVVLVEDARGVLPAFEGEGSDIDMAFQALQALCQR